MDNVRQIIFYTIITPTEFVRHGEVTQRKCSTSHKENFRHCKIFHGKAEKQANYCRKCSTYKIINSKAEKQAKYYRKPSQFRFTSPSIHLRQVGYYKTVAKRNEAQIDGIYTLETTAI